MLTAADKESVASLPSRSLFARDRLPHFAAVKLSCVAHGVGILSETPPAAALVVSAEFVSAQHSPPRIIPALGQVSENLPESSVSDVWRVLQEQEARSYHVSDAEHFPIEAASLTVDASSRADS
jgi:hypothetical protein